MYPTILITAAIQGFLLSTGLLLRNIKTQQANIYLSCILFIFSVELLFSWGGLTGYNNSKGVFRFWLFKTYLMIAPSLWLFFKHNTTAQYKFSLQHFLYFLPALVEIVIGFVSYYSRGTVFTFTRSSFWFVYTEILPLLLTAMVLVWQGIAIAKLHRQFKGNTNDAVQSHILKIKIVYVVFCFLVIVWASMTFFSFHVMRFVEVFLAILLFVLAYIAFFYPDFFATPRSFQVKATDEFKAFNDEESFSRLTQLFVQQA
ncbi:MAG: hypothetical protein ABUT20_53215, partial [Bacteroidota bacterium]